MKQKLLSIVLAVAMVMTMIPNMAFSVSATGSVIEISTAEQLRAFADRVNNSESALSAKLMADIDLGGRNNPWTPIGSEKSIFTGTFDGNGHRITGLYIANPDSDNQGVFGSMSAPSMVKNLSVDGTVTGSHNIGGIVGKSWGATVKNCCYTGSVEGKTYVGGIVGENTDGGKIEGCYTNGGTILGDDRVVGGIAGMSGLGTVTDCYNDALVVGSDCGGIIGIGRRAYNCYNSGVVFGISNVGGLVGNTLGTEPNLVNCYYIRENVRSDNSYGTPKTANDFTEQKTFQGWDFTAVWGMGMKDGKIVRPVLRAIPEMSIAGEISPTPAPKPTVGGFTDVYEGDFYADPVVWAVGQGITGGKGNGKFAPKDSCTRGEIVTFLWRAAGQPEPTITENPFADVKESDFFYKPVLWAVENKVTGGTGTNEDGKALFSPGKPCTRGQAVTFQWRAAGNPGSSTASVFTDVKPGEYYTEAVNWAVANNITGGTGDGKFSPNSTCTRGQIVTFLYRGRDVA